MTDATTPDLPVESDVAGETQEEKTARLNFFSDAVRAGLHSSAMDILEQMEANAVPDAAACLMTGACQFLAEIYEGMATRVGADKSACKTHMLESAGLYFDTYCQMTVKESLQAATGQKAESGKVN